MVAENAPPDTLLERIDDVRRRGTTIFSIDNGSKDLASLSHESLVPELLVPNSFGAGWVSHPVGQDHDEPDHGRHAVPEETLTALRDAVAGFEMTQHLVSLAVADDDVLQPRWRLRLRNFIERVSGEPA